MTKTLGFCFECQPLTGGREKEHEKLDQLFSQNFPSNMTMSFLLFRSPDIEENLLVAERDAHESPASSVDAGVRGAHEVAEEAHG